MTATDHPIKHALGTMSHYEICAMIHASYITANTIIAKGFQVSTKEWEEKKLCESSINFANAELRKRGLKYTPVYEVLWRFRVSGEQIDLWTPYHAVKPHPRFPSGTATKSNMISNFNEIENALEAMRPGMSREPRTEAKFVKTRERAPWN